MMGTVLPLIKVYIFQIVHIFQIMLQDNNQAIDVVITISTKYYEKIHLFS